MRTQTERRLAQMNTAAKSKAILVPLLEELLERPVDVETEEDFRYMDMLLRARAVPRQKGIFSPSMLGSCLRQAYFSKRGEKKIPILSPQTNGYFLHGNFVHLKWQFALWKLMGQKLIEIAAMPAETLKLAWQEGDVDRGPWRWAVEYRVVDGDWGGTIDAIVIIDGKLYIVDFKGINLIDFQRTVKNGAPVAYRRQLVGYAKIAAKVLDIEFAGCLLISECKAGPLGGRGNPIALHETFVPIEEFSGDVNRRLRTLRWFDSREELPPIECKSTKHMGFVECPFSANCHAEVLVAQREHEAKARTRSQNLTPARPNR